MARIRKGSAYHRLERPYTRKSKYSKHNFVRATPHMSIARFERGKKNGTYNKKSQPVTERDIQIRHNALEAARQTGVRVMETQVGKDAFFFKLCVYPFHVLRENPLASGAGADRMSTGMARSFGKPISVAAQITTGKVLFEARV